jgi:hypothetical protein
MIIIVANIPNIKLNNIKSGNAVDQYSPMPAITDFKTYVVVAVVVAIIRPL